MRYAVLIGMAVAAAILIRIKREYKGRILACFGVLIIVMGIFYNVRLMDKVLPAINPVNQSFYQTRYLEDGEYPDSLLMQLFKGKTVYVKDDFYTVYDTEQENKSFLYAYYHTRNMYWFLERAEAGIVGDHALNKKHVDPAKRDSDFVRLGYTNDMFRYCFLYNDLIDEPGNYFNYYWYFYEYLNDISAYICEETDSEGKTVFTADELVVLWQPKNKAADGKNRNSAMAIPPAPGQTPDRDIYGNAIIRSDGREEEDIYIMTRSYYDTEVSTDE
ncbi:MAG: hypothetical protein IJT37_13420 [Lachnospiraceae bacterium]|nr:hypothetical protein [Lachnospiraceae bacterium]